MNSFRNLAKIGLFLGVASIVGCTVPGPRSEQVMAFPATTAGADAPKFIEGDAADAQAAAGPHDWVLVSTDAKGDTYLVKNYLPKGASTTNWNELITYMNTVKPDESVADFMNRQKSILEQKCPGTAWQVLSQADSEIVYESKVHNCPAIGDQDEIVRVIYGDTAMFRISYTAKSADITAAKRAEAIKLLSEFELQNKS
jgi:hypothetical protein